MKSILLTIGRLDIGGAEMRLLQFLKELEKKAKTEFDVTVYIVSGLPGRLDEAYREVGATLIYGRPGVAGLLDLYKLTRERSFHTVHVNAALAGGYYCFAAAAAGVRRRISHIRDVGYDEDTVFRKMRSSISRIFLNAFSTELVGVCNSARKFAGVKEGKWKTVYNGVRVPDTLDISLAPNKDQSLNILFLGRLEPQKNPQRALRVLDAVKKKLPGTPVELKFVGRKVEPVISELESEISRLGLERNVCFAGELADPFPEIVASSVLLQTSIHEGLPGVVIESLLCGLPVVASKLPGAEEIAQRVVGVKLVDLGSPDCVWAETLIEHWKSSDRAEIRKSFSVGPFTFDSYYRQMLELWSGD